MCVCENVFFRVTYFSISLFLQVRGAQEEEEEEEEGVLGSVLLLSPLLVEGISMNDKNQRKVNNMKIKGRISSENQRFTVLIILFYSQGHLMDFHGETSRC